MPKKRTQVKDLPKKEKELSKDDLKRVKGGFAPQTQSDIAQTKAGAKEQRDLEKFSRQRRTKVKDLPK